MSLFPSIFCTISALSLYGEYVVRSFLPNGVFLPCDHGLDFFTSAYYVRIQSIKIMVIFSPILFTLDIGKTFQYYEEFNIS